MTELRTVHSHFRVSPVALVAATAALTVIGGASLGATVEAASTWSVACTNNLTQDTTALQSAITNAEHHGGLVSIAAGTCAVDTDLAIKFPVTVTGAGVAATFVVQHGDHDIFNITADNVTIENINLDTATYNTTAPVPKNPNPPVIYSSANNTTVRNVTGETGSGFGMRITGPLPCYSRVNGGAVVTNVTMTTLGTGGFAAVDIDCQSHASLSNIRIHGGLISVYRDSNLTLTGEQFAPGPNAKPCAPPWFVTGDSVSPSQNITIDQVTSAGGHGLVEGAVVNLVTTNQTVLNIAC